MLDMELPGLAHSISGPLSPCEGMLKDLSLDALQLCERDGEAARLTGPALSGRAPPSLTLIVRWKHALQRALIRWLRVRACVE